MEHALRISIFGLGYVGTVSAACLAADGNQVLGVDPVPDKVDLINQGHSPIVEAEIGGIIEETVAKGQLRATQDPIAAVIETDLSFVCVGTPS
jgi:GDP-mannose 6-dehydrogenase